MADIRFNFEFDKLDDANKFLQEMAKAAKEIKKSIQDSGKTFSTDAAGAKKLATASKQVANEKKKLTAVEREELRQRKALETVNAKLALAQSKENRELLEKQKQLRKVNAELRNGGKNTNAWSKALGSFQFKFNALGNIAANVVSKMTQAIKNGINQFTSLEKIIKSNQITSDKFDVVVGRMKGSFEALNRAIASGDFSNIGKILRDAANAAEDYVLALDILGDTQRALDIQQARSVRQIRQLEETYNDTSKSNEERLAAAKKAQLIINDLQSKQETISRQYFENEYKRIQTSFGLTEDQISLYKRFIENYGLLTDEQVTKLEELRNIQNTVGKEFKTVTEVVGTSPEGVPIVRQTRVMTDEAAKFKVAVEELSAAFGFDLLPIMKAIVGTNDEERQAITDTTIAYEQAITQTQRYANRNAAAIGTIINSMKKAKKDKDSGVVPSIAEITLGKPEDVQLDADIISSILTETADDSRERRKKEFEEKKKIKDEEIQLEKDAEQQKKSIRQAASDETFAALSSAITNYDSLIESQKQKELSAAGDNAAKRLEIERKYSEKQKNIAYASAIINAAEGITKIWAKWAANPVVAGVLTGIEAAATGLQLATIKRQKFAKGGWIDGDPHSRGGVNIEAEGGEFIIRKQAASKYKSLVEAINQDDQMKIMNAMSRDRKIMLNGGGDPYNKKIYELLKNQPVYGQDGEFYYLHKGNKLLKAKK